MKFMTAFLGLLGMAAIAQQMKVGTGALQHYHNFTSAFVEERNIDVWLPDHYSEKEKYAVVYMHDGQMLFDASTTWNRQEWNVDETAARLIAEGKTQKFIIVGILSIARIRHDDLFPQKPFESLDIKFQDSLYTFRKNTENPYFGGKINSDNYLKFIVAELKPFIDKTFSTKKDSANTFIAGSSMGGLISLYAICEYPEVFGGAACLSTHWTGIYTADHNPIPKGFLDYMRNHLPSPKNHKIYFDYGSETLDAMYKPFQLQADEIMKIKGYTSKSWVTKEFPGDDHSEQSWSKRLHIPLEFLLGK